MIKFNSCKITPKDINILNSVVNAASDETHLKIESPITNWMCQILTIGDTKIPVITSKAHSSDNIEYFITVKGTCVNSNIQLEAVIIDSESLDTPLDFQLTPLREMYILANVQEQESDSARIPHSQLSACSKLIQEMYSDDPDYDSNMPVPKVFFSKLDFDTYMSNLSVTLEESILLWMESTGRLSVNMDDEGILVPTILKNNIKRVYMHGAARNQVRVEFHNSSIHEFRNMSAAVQVEICNEILSILPVI